jgi:hypothetical protein
MFRRPKKRPPEKKPISEHIPDRVFNDLVETAMGYPDFAEYIKAHERVQVDPHGGFVTGLRKGAKSSFSTFSTKEVLKEIEMRKKRK